MEALNKIGLSLSGGGYRAAAFHLGTLNKLNEMGILEKINVLSTISGGSITGAAWALSDQKYEDFHKTMKKDLESKDVIKFIFRSSSFFLAALFLLLFLGGALYVSFTSISWLTFPIIAVFVILLMKFQYKIFPVSKIIEAAYNTFFFDKKTLADFKIGKPIMAIGSSNLHTGRPFTFSQKKMGDSTYSFGAEYKPPVVFLHKEFPVARAVMASSCVPFAFSPVNIDAVFFKNQEDIKRCKPVLIDGGVYDNQGIQKLSEAKSSYGCDTIITSDAGGNFIADKTYPNAIALLIRTVDLFMFRIKSSQLQKNVYNNVKGAGREIAYISLGWELKNVISGFIKNLEDGTIMPSLCTMHNLDPAWVADPENYIDEITQKLQQNTGYDKIIKRDLTPAEWFTAKSVGTNLTALSTNETNLLIRHAENMTELQVKLYCPSLVIKPFI